MNHINTIPTPSVILFTRRLEENINRFARIAKDSGVVLRPHVKTHRHPRIMALQSKAGAQGFTVSTLDEARSCIRYGYNNLSYAVPIEPGKFLQACEIANSGAALHLLTDSLAVAKELEQHAAHHGWQPSVFMKIDCGNHRVGVDPDSNAAMKLAQYLHAAEHLTFAGVLAHSGYVYHVSNIL